MKNSDDKKVISGFLWNTVGQLADAANGIYLYVIRYLFGGEAFGLFAIAFSLIELFNRFLIGGFGDAATYFVSRYRNDKDLNDLEKEEKVHQALAYCLLIPLILAILLTLALSYSSNWLYSTFWSNHNPELQELLLGLSLLLPLNVLVRIPLEALKGLLDMRWAVWVTGGVLPIVNFSSTVVFYFMGWGLWSLVAAQLLAHTISVFASIYAFTKYFSIGKTLRLLPSAFTQKEFHKFAFPQSLNMLMNFGLVRMDTLMLSMWVGTNEVGIYTLLSEFTRTMRSAKTSFSKIFSPLVAKYQGLKDRDGIQRALVSVSYWTALLSTPFLYSIVVFYSDFVLGPQNSWGYSPWIVWLLSVGPLLSCYWGLAGNLLLMTGHSLILMKNSMLLFALNVGLNYWLIPKYGLVGAAAATAISSLGISCIQATEMWVTEKVKFQYKTSFRLLIVAFICAIPLFWVNTSSWTVYFQGKESWLYWGSKALLLVISLLLFTLLQLFLPGENSLLKKWENYKSGNSFI